MKTSCASVSVTQSVKKVRIISIFGHGFLPQSLLCKWRVRGGRCGGALAGGLTDRHPLTGGSGVIDPNTPKKDSQSTFDTKHKIKE